MQADAELSSELTAADRLLAVGTLLVDTRGAAGDDAVASLIEDARVPDDDDVGASSDDEIDDELHEDDDDGSSLYAFRHAQTPGLPRGSLTRWQTMYALATPAAQTQFSRFAERHRVLAAATRGARNESRAGTPALIRIETDVAQPLVLPIHVAPLPRRVLRRRTLRLGHVQIHSMAVAFVGVRNPSSDLPITAQLLVPRDSESGSGQVIRFSFRLFVVLLETDKHTFVCVGACALRGGTTTSGVGARCNGTTRTSAGVADATRIARRDAARGAQCHAGRHRSADVARHVWQRLVGVVGCGARRRAAV
jgi:hypothetical protein